MWRAFSRNAPGEWTELQIVEIPTTGPFRSADAARAASGMSLPSQLRNYLGLEAESGGNQSRDAIETWASDAEIAASAYDWAGAPRIRAIEEAIAAFMPVSSSPGMFEKPTTLAWHDHTGAVIPIVGDRAEIRVEYVPEPRDAYRVDRLRYRHATPQHAFETILDWRGYFGRNSGILDGWTMMRESGRGYAASFVGEAGFIVGTVLRRLTTPAITLEEDPWAKARCVDTEQRYPQVAMECPDLAKVRPPRMDRAMVWVHGTASCGTVGLKDLLLPNFGHLAPAIRGIVFRFEHDTFVKMRHNARELRDLIKDRVAADHLLLAGHSRGGCVARLAADMLQRDGYRGEVSVYTFGTPHDGTPLVDIGKTALNLLVKASQELMTNAPLPIMTPLTKAMCYTLDSADLPPGIKDMGKDGEVEAFKDLRVPADARSWGSDFDIYGKESGFGPAASGTLRGALGSEPNDLVVPTTSALAFGTRQPTLACSHVRYFVEPSVRNAVQQFLAPPPAVPAVTAPAAATPASVPRDIVAPEKAVFKNQSKPFKLVLKTQDQKDEGNLSASDEKTTGGLDG
jgi:Lipase (class 3)